MTDRMTESLLELLWQLAVTVTVSLRSVTHLEVRHCHTKLQQQWEGLLTAWWGLSSLTAVCCHTEQSPHHLTTTAPSPHKQSPPISSSHHHITNNHHITPISSSGYKLVFYANVHPHPPSLVSRYLRIYRPTSHIFYFFGFNGRGGMN